MAEQERKTTADRVDALLESKKLELEKASVAIDAAEAKVKQDVETDKLDLEIFKSVTTPNRNN